jgi:RNA polymerase sigma factor (sigma-70 family)
MEIFEGGGLQPQRGGPVSKEDWTFVMEQMAKYHIEITNKLERYADSCPGFTMKDLEQEFLIKLVYNSSKLREAKATGKLNLGYLKNVIRNLVIDRIRKAKRQKEQQLTYIKEKGEQLALDRMELSFDKDYPESHLEEALRTIWPSVKEIHQLCLCYAYIEERTHADIAMIIGKSKAEVNSLLQRARNSVRTKVQRYLNNS